jgi:putative ABC transport system permease protein
LRLTVATLLPELSRAARRLAKSPGFTFTAVSTLALAVGLNAAVFALVDALLFRPLPVRAPEELVRIYSAVPHELMSHAPMSRADYRDLRHQCESFTDIAASFLTTLAFEDETSARLVLAEAVTPNYFTLLGVRPRLGRLFTPADGRDVAAPNLFGGPSLAVLSNRAWRRRFGSDPGVVGRTVRLNGRPFTVAGVAPRDFFGLARGVSPEVWLPLGEERPGASADREIRSLWLVARLRPGASLPRARAEVDTVARRLQEDHPETNRDRAFVVLPSPAVRVLPGLDRTLYPASFASLLVAGLVLLIACANLAHLFLVRGLARRRELSIRLALGATRPALLRSLLAEGLLLSLAGGAIGLLFAAATPLVVNVLPASLPVDVALGLAVDWRVVLFALFASTLTTLAFATAPAVAVTRIDLSSALRQAAFDALAGTSRLRRVLLVSQLALCLVLLVCAGLALRSVVSVRHMDLGFDPEGAVVASFAPRLQGYDPPRSEALFRRVLDEIRARPDTVAAGLASHLPLSVEVTYERVADRGDARPPTAWPVVDTALVGPGYFAAMGVPVLRGRPFDDHDTPGSTPVVVVNESLARLLWPGGQRAVGQQLRLAGAPRGQEVVGVVRDGRYRTLGEAPRPFLFRCFAQAWRDRRAHAGEVATGYQTLVVRTRARPSVALRAIRQIARRLDPGLAFARLTTLAEATSLPLLLPAAAVSLFAVLGTLGLALVALGIAGVVAYSAAGRTREIGVRIALGARRRDVVRLLMAEAVAVTVVGLAVGLALAAASTRGISWMLYGVRPLDAATYALAAAFLAGVALLAGYVPARRAAGMEPQAALRCE